MNERHAPPMNNMGREARGLCSTQEILQQLHRLPGGAQLLQLAQDWPEQVELVGGAVRDMLLGNTPRELDVVVESDAREFAQALAGRLGTLAGQNPQERFETASHDRFRTALVHWCDGRIDIATRRSETYTAPGALPEVRAGSADEDLRRRDFTVNAIAMALDGPQRGELRSVPQAIDDLRDGRLRVLHDASFTDDPTRLLRLARYRARLGFVIDEATAELAARAIDAGALDTVSGARLGAELRLALAEADALASVRELARLGVLTALQPNMHLDERLFLAASALLPAGEGRVDLLLLASLLRAEAARQQRLTPNEARSLLDRLEFPAADRDRVLATITAVDRLSSRLADIGTASALHALVSGIPPEGISLAAVLAGANGEEHASAWFSRLRHVRLQITGEDLITAGIPAGPEIGRRLRRVLERRLDAEIGDGRDAELQAALEP